MKITEIEEKWTLIEGARVIEKESESAKKHSIIYIELHLLYQLI